MGSIKLLAAAALAAVTEAAKNNTPETRGAAERATNKLARTCDGALPDGGNTPDRRCRAELRDGTAGEATEKFQAYLRDLSGGASATQKESKAAEKAEGPKGA